MDFIGHPLFDRGITGRNFSAKRIHPPLEKSLSPQVDVFMSIRFWYVQVRLFERIELLDRVAIKPFHVCATRSAVSDIFAVFIFLDLLRCRRRNIDDKSLRIFPPYSRILNSPFALGASSDILFTSFSKLTHKNVGVLATPTFYYKFYLRYNQFISECCRRRKECCRGRRSRCHRMRNLPKRG